ncbi:MAG: dCTP deaminase [Deinococcus sp.]|nr:dCTP deaminase [Deinococcus sp.]
MAICVDWQIRKLCEEQAMIQPFDPALINPASIDVRFGQHVIPEGGTEPSLVGESGYELGPGEFILAETLEVIRTPRHCALQFLLKSSVARLGVQHLLSGYADPSFTGRLTLQLKNVNSRTPRVLYPGQRIGQLVVHKLDSWCEVDYSQRVDSHYKDQPGVVPSWLEQKK